ncbi:DNA polymerase [bacterium]|nr:DNA polymerase [bacterium]
MSRYVFDIESNDLLRGCDRCWIVYLYDLQTKEQTYFLEGDLGWIPLMKKATLLAGHNIVGYDLPALKKMFGFEPSPECQIHDTLVMSITQDYQRFGYNCKHGLAAWGEHLGFPKGDWEDFSKWDPAMLKYCQRDVELNVQVYRILCKEFMTIVKEKPRFKPYLRAEHYVLEWCARAHLVGWPFDVTAAQGLFEEMTDKLEATTNHMSSKLGRKAKPKDSRHGIVSTKTPKYIKSGAYNHHTMGWFNVHPDTYEELYEGDPYWIDPDMGGLDDDDDPEKIIVGEYCRVEFPRLKLSSSHDVKIFLYRLGWVPLEWNTKTNPVTKRKERTSPKITPDSLEFLGGDGKLYIEYLTIKSRHGVLNSWLEEVDEDGLLHGDCFTIGTPSMRSRHKLIVNVPSGDVDTLYGKEMRMLFQAKKGWKMVGCDSSGNQARGLAHYLNNDEYTDILLNGDIHNYNAEKLTEVLESMGINHVVPRSNAKRILYAFLFGAAGGKLWSYIFGNNKSKEGNKLKEGFTDAVPGFSELVKGLERELRKTKKFGDGYIKGIAGNRIYVDSFHKLLVYLLQACEKATCAAACMLLMKWLEEENIPWEPCIFYHDELDFQVPEEYAERAKELGSLAFKEGPKLFGIEIMDGDGAVGDNWYDVH